MSNFLEKIEKYFGNQSELILFIKKSWKTTIFLISISLLIGLCYIYLAPKVYDATVVIQTEEVKLTNKKILSFEAIKIRSSSLNFYITNKSILKECKIESTPSEIKRLIKNLDVNKVRGANNFIEIKLSYEKDSIEGCLKSIVEGLSQEQSNMSQKTLDYEVSNLKRDKEEYEKLKNSNFYNNPVIYLELKGLSDKIKMEEIEIQKIQENPGLIIFSGFEIKENISPKKYIILAFSIVIGFCLSILFNFKNFFN